HAPKVTGQTASSSGLQEFKNADTTSPVWLPGCGPCVRRQFICRQGYNASHEPLAVCACCHRTKYKCGGNGSAPPTKKPATNHARSKSRRRTPVANVTGVTDATTTQPEDEVPAASTVPQDDETPSVTTALREDGALVEHDMSPAVATAMQVDESPANGISQGEAAPPDTGGVEESASIASTVHE
ncbi:hypothetical protein CY34DRAFT_110939, partial [Suillus luteus UH-Slu-Lm8-n1]